MSLTVTPLSEKHLAEIRLTVDRAMAQWFAANPNATPLDTVTSLERVVLFLRQNGSPSKQARHVTSVAFTFGEQLVRAASWRWMNIADDGTLNPGLLSPDGRHACLPVDLVTRHLMRGDVPSLPKLFTALTDGELPQSEGLLLVP